MQAGDLPRVRLVPARDPKWLNPVSDAFPQRYHEV
jgi:hypothetical protein